MIIVAIIGPWIAPYDPWALGQEALLPPGDHIFGTDNLGRDVFSRVLYGARPSMIIGIGSAMLAVFMGILIGLVSGYFGGKLDDLLMRITDIVLVLPAFFIIIILVSFFGGSIQLIIMILGLFSWCGCARMTRVMVLSIKQSTYVEAARAMGMSNSGIMFKEILPNALPPAIVEASLLIGRCILLESGLSFLGLGDPNLMSWGSMLFNAQAYIRSAWWMMVFPGLAILLAVLAFNFIGEGFNDALNPRLKEQ